MTANKTLEVSLNILHRIICTNCSKDYLHVVRHMRMEQLCKNLTKHFDPNRLLSTIEKNLRPALKINIVQDSNKHMFSQKYTILQALNHGRHPINIPNDYPA